MDIDREIIEEARFSGTGSISMRLIKTGKIDIVQEVSVEAIQKAYEKAGEKFGIVEGIDEIREQNKTRSMKKIEAAVAKAVVEVRDTKRKSPKGRKRA